MYALLSNTPSSAYHSRMVRWITCSFPGYPCLIRCAFSIAIWSSGFLVPSLSFDYILITQKFVICVMQYTVIFGEYLSCVKIWCMKPYFVEYTTWTLCIYNFISFSRLSEVLENDFNVYKIEITSDPNLSITVSWWLNPTQALITITLSAMDGVE